VFRKRYPRIYELKDFVPSPHPPGAYFRDLDASLAQIAQKRKQYDDIEAELGELDDVAWALLKEEVRPYVLRKDKHRAWQQLFDILNQAKAYGYLKREGCEDIEFIPRATTDTQQTPDLKAKRADMMVLCEVKTLNVSQDEIVRMNSGGVGTTHRELNDLFKNKLSVTLDSAKRQMNAYFSGEARRIAYVIVNFDDRLHEYGGDYRQQIDEFLELRRTDTLEVVLDIKPPFYTAGGDGVGAKELS
jgi:hypothetical protein